MAPRLLTLNDYEITRDGEVINKITGHHLIPQPNNKGYLRVSIGKKLLFVHRLVAEKFIPNPNNYEQVNHIDGNKRNNSADNLEWVTNQENRNHAVEHHLHLSGEQCNYAKLNEEKVRYIRKHLEISNTDLANQFGVARQTISDVRQRKTWKHVV